jgi:hypothetical protein
MKWEGSLTRWVLQENGRKKPFEAGFGWSSTSNQIVEEKQQRRIMKGYSFH